MFATCPKCGCTDVEYGTDNPRRSFEDPPTYFECPACGRYFDIDPSADCDGDGYRDDSSPAAEIAVSIGVVQRLRWQRDALAERLTRTESVPDYLTDDVSVDEVKPSAAVINAEMREALEKCAHGMTVELDDHEQGFVSRRPGDFYRNALDAARAALAKADGGTR